MGQPELPPDAAASRSEAFVGHLFEVDHHLALYKSRFELVFAAFRNIEDPRFGPQPEETVVIAFLGSRTFVQVLRHAKARGFNDLDELFILNDAIGRGNERLGVVGGLALR